MHPILTIKLVLKFDKSKEIRFSQFINIPYIIVTLEVSKFDKFNEVRFLQSLNISCISITFSVLNFDTSK